MALADGPIKQILANPDLAVKPRHLWPTKFKHAKVQVGSQHGWNLIGHGLYKRGILRLCTKDDLIWDAHRNLLAAGSFGVGTGNNLTLEDGTLAEVLRLIANPIPSDEVQEEVVGDNGTLPWPGCWQTLLLHEEPLLFWNCEDMYASFYLFKVLLL